MTATFETSTVRPSPPGPQICLLTNLPSFTTWEAASGYLEHQCGGHSPVRVKWQCEGCSGWHFWATAPTDSNGGSLAGSWHACGLFSKPTQSAAIQTCRTCRRPLIVCGDCQQIIVSFYCPHWLKGKYFRV